MLSQFFLRYPMLSHFLLSICWTGRQTVDELKDMIALLKKKTTLTQPTSTQTSADDKKPFARDAAILLVYPHISQHNDSIS